MNTCKHTNSTKYPPLTILSLLALCLAFTLILTPGVTTSMAQGSESNPGKCKDGKDNDDDGLIDCEDPDCIPHCDGGGGNGMMVVEDAREYEDFCGDQDPDIVAEAVCPEGKVLVAVDCETDPQIPITDGSTPIIPTIFLLTLNAFTLSAFTGGADAGGTNQTQPLLASLPQSQRCSLRCSTPRGSGTGITGTLTAVAYCEQP
ncbi:hypothetical protein MYX76_04410 [Desulfobacterota bacterium AH_259_B03_O07]|nr:hypothetical protein [Desulfobacterota bacterium AH_259_B03_O07]